MTFQFTFWKRLTHNLTRFSIFVIYSGIFGFPLNRENGNNQFFDCISDLRLAKEKPYL